MKLLRHLDDIKRSMEVSQIEPSWYERHWLRERPTRRPSVASRVLSIACTAARTVIGVMTGALSTGQRPVTHRRAA